MRVLLMQSAITLLAHGLVIYFYYQLLIEWQTSARKALLAFQT